MIGMSGQQDLQGGCDTRLIHGLEPFIFYSVQLNSILSAYYGPFRPRNASLGPGHKYGPKLAWGAGMKTIAPGMQALTCKHAIIDRGWPSFEENGKASLRVTRV
jgi:hypothetical protein